MRGLWFGILVYRWAALVWMTAAALTHWDTVDEQELALTALATTVVWNIWLSARKGWLRRLDRLVDLAIAFALLPIGGFVMDDGAILDELFFATSYPAVAALTMGAGTGVVGGLLAGLVLSVGLVLSRVTNGLELDELGGGWGELVNGAVYFLAAGGAAGAVRRVLLESAAERTRALEEAARQHDRAVRLAERDALGREIHDSVLQSLALVGRRGKEMARRDAVASAEVRELADLAGKQEQALRILLSEPPEEPPLGMVSVKTALEAAAFGVGGIQVTVTSVGPAWLPAESMHDVAAAVRQALENVEQHADASRVTVFAEALDGELVISIRDDGVGFAYDESDLRRLGKLGMSKSMRGRIEGLGGVMLVHSAPGQGTEVEFRLPVERVTAS
jgi:signal transduction histidine kinase